MEAKNNPFYELRSRLYASAAAGCSIISEDFRLQRAIDAFKPMSGSNKVFGRLYSMCCDLLKSDDPADAITDCIALADALAVTQGTFADTSETQPANKIEKVMPQQIPYSKLREYISEIQRYTTSYRKVSAGFCEAIRDPRLLSAFIGISGSNSASADELSQIFESVYGDSLIQPLLDSIDLSDNNSTGKQITCICRIAGERQNDLYIRLAETPENPQNVRIRAIEAMSCSESNSERLLTLYQTEKGKIKTAALTSLAKLNAAEAEPVLSKLLSKYKPSYNEIIAASGGDACTEFVRSAVEYAVSEDHSPNDKSRPHISDIAHMLGNKKNITDCYIKLTEWYNGKSSKTKSEHNSIIRIMNDAVIRDMNKCLCENVFFHSDDEYREMIFVLYEKYPDVFFPARFYLELITAPMNAFTAMRDDAEKHIDHVFNILNNIYTDAEGVYRLPCAAPQNSSRSYNSVLFKNLPDDLLDFLADTRTIEKDAKSLLLTGSKRDTTAQIANDKCVAFIELIKKCSPEDHSRVKAAAERLAQVVSETFPNIHAISILGKSTDRPLDGIVQRLVEYRLKNQSKVVAYYEFNSLELPEELLISELKALAEKLPKMQKSIEPNLLTGQLNQIKNALTRHGIT